MAINTVRASSVSRAGRHAHELRDFQAHLVAYLLVNLALFLINVATPGSWWFYWPLLGWGAGVLAHAATSTTCAPSRNAAPASAHQEPEPPWGWSGASRPRGRVAPVLTATLPPERPRTAQD